MYTILSIEDDLLLAKELQQYFSKYEFDFHITTNFSNVLEQIDDLKPDLILLDVNLPIKDGFQFCKDIRMQSDVPIIIVSSRDEKMDQLMGLNLGADDYIAKPIDLDVLLLKIQALLRRSNRQVDMTAQSQLSLNGLTLDTEHFTLNFQEKTEELTKNETKILQKLMSKPNSYIHRDDLMRYLWENESFIDDNTLNVNLSRVRKKIQLLAGKDFIETKRLVGYRFMNEVE